MIDFQINNNNYTMTHHPAGEGVSLIFKLFAVAAEPLGRVLDSVISQVVKKVISGEITLDGDVKDVLKSLDGDFDFSSVAGDLKLALATINEQQLIKDLLKYVVREGASLASQAVFDRAFANNYGELAALLIRVIVENGFLGFFTSALTGK
jgi:hypothetical protein